MACSRASFLLSVIVSAIAVLFWVDSIARKCQTNAENYFFGLGGNTLAAMRARGV